jgi:hypothetical protein
MDFIDDFDFSILKYNYYLNDIYKLIITIKVDKHNILDDVTVVIKDGYKKICHVGIDNSDYKNSLKRKDDTMDSYTWVVSCETKNPGSGLVDLIIWISLYIFRKFQLRDLVNPKKFTTMEWARRNDTYIVIYNLLRKSKYYKDLEYEKKVETLNNEILWYYEKFNFKRKDKKKLIKWFLDLEYSGDIDSIKISKLYDKKKSLKWFQHIQDAEDYDSVTITQLYEHEDFSEKEAIWKPLSLKELKLNIEKAQNNLRLEYV